MKSGWMLAAVLAGCYQPTLHEGAPCGPGATCPSGQECRAGTCYFTTTPTDASDRGDGDDLDSSMITADASPDAPTIGPWSTPVALTSLEIAESGEDDPSITSDHLTVVISADSVVAPNDRDLFIGKRTAMTDTFTVTPLTALSATPSRETSPEISGDGTTIYFVSDRVTAGDGDVYTSTQTSGVWAAPTLVTQLSGGNVGDLAISPDGLTAAVAHGGTFYIHTRSSTTATWGTGTAHGEINSGLTSSTAPSITNGAALIYFHAQNPRDIYTARRLGNGTFKAATPVTELNTTANREAAPFVNQADDYMIFEIEYDIFETTR